MRDIKVSLNFTNKLYEELKEEKNVVRTGNKTLRIENTQLRAPCDEFTKQMKENSSRLLRTEQCSRHFNLEIKNLPIKETRTFIAFLKKLEKKFGETITANDIDICHRVPVANSTVNKHFVAQFIRRGRRNSVRKKVRRFRLNRTDLGFASYALFYINEQLWPEMKNASWKGNRREEGNGLKVSLGGQWADICAEVRTFGSHSTIF